MSENYKNDVKNSVLTENTAQSVYKHLRELESNRAHVLSRWIWELLQNARDASLGDEQLVVSVERRGDDLTFLHNGRGFREKEIAHLIFHGSTKADDEASLGRFGSGFLTTHLLSAEIGVSGQLDDSRSFDFKLVRQADSPESLRRDMDAAWGSFTPSHAPLADPLPGDFSTRFCYPIITEEATCVVTEGIKRLKCCAPLVLVFNPKFQRIRIDDLGSTTEFAVTGRQSLADPAIAEVTVVKDDGDRRGSIYLSVERDGVTVALQVQADEDQSRRCVQQGGPRLYLGFPLIGTEQFSLPAAANSFEFRPTEARDGIYLAQAENQANLVNQQMVEEALALHVKLIRFAAQNGYLNSAVLAVTPPVKKESWLNVDWLRQTIQDKLIGPIRKTPSVVSNQGEPLAPKNAILPYADDKEQVLELRHLLEGVEDTSKLLPSSGEAEPWCNAVKSWVSINGGEATFEEAWDGRKLAQYVDSRAKKANEDYGSLDELRTLLVDKKDAVEWLNGVCDFLMRNGFSDALDTLNLVLNQDGCLDVLPNLYRDCGIDEELKRIADDLLDIGQRAELRDVRLTSLDEKKGKGDLGNAEVVQRILTELRKQAKQGEALDAKKPREASIYLLAWMVRNGCIDKVEHFPVWSEAHDREDPEIIWLGLTETEDAELPLAPIQAWPSGLQEFADLFPRSRILAGDYFDRLCEVEHWERLSDDGLLRVDVILQRSQDHNFQECPPDESLPEGKDHKSACQVEVVDVAYFVKDDIGIMSRVRDARRRGVLLWRFLTEYLIPKDRKSLDVIEADCECEESHSYYRAAWLTPLAKNRWIPLGGNKRDKATARSLAVLFSNDDSTKHLGTNEGALRLLTALGVKQLDLTMEFLAGDDNARSRLDVDLAKILESTGGDLTPVNQFVKDLKDDGGLMGHLDERRERRQRIHQNQVLGVKVESLVRECLEEAGFVVRRTGIGSDYEIEYDPLDEARGEALGIEVLRDGRTWLIEVKGTRGNEVRMTPTQARIAVREQGQFLLCVVPVDTEATGIDVDQLRTAMRFVKGIGEHLNSFCDDLDGLDEARQAAMEGDTSGGVRLEIVGGKARICVNDTLWGNAIPLDGLVAALSRGAA